jgi:hypothetical protein
MYGLYEKTKTNDSLIYSIKEEISIFGCNNGYIPWLLNTKLEPASNEPYKWHVEIEKDLNLNGEEYYHGKTIVIDIKPKNKEEKYLTMAELTDVWGFSAASWTPMLFRMKMLFTDEDENEADKKYFEIKNNIKLETVYSIIYARGSIKNGKIVGMWTPPSMSPTNSTLLWPDTIKFFFDQIKEKDEWIFSNNIFV